jgi:C-terminal processing protease CtpA/Prc
MAMGINKKKTWGAAALAGAAVSAIAWVALAGQGGPPSQPDLRIDATVREQTVAAVIAQLDANYVFPDQAARLGRQLRARLEHGDYDSATSAQAFAETLTADLQRDSHDRHLVVEYFAQPVPFPSPRQEAADRAAEAVEQQRYNFGYESVARLRGNLGYVELRSFARPGAATERIAAAMTLLGDTKALVIDLRKCGGGDPETVMQFASYLFDAPTHLNDVYWRDENRLERRWTTATVPGRKYGSARKVFVLTSQDTFSGCEDFAYALKYARRATLIGETTGGGAHAGSPHRLGEHFMMFVPSGRPINPVTHADWEGVGVVPDVAVSADDALEVAEAAALKAVIAQETDPEWKRRLQGRLDEIE